MKISIRALWAMGLLMTLVQPGYAQNGEIQFKSIPTQFIAAVGDPHASSGKNAYTWGLWTQDPGPRGVELNDFDEMLANEGMAPDNWKFIQHDWWLEEHGLIMEPPHKVLPVGKYLVTGDREVTTMLTIYPMDMSGNQRWELANGATLFDVTHLACRSARYTPAKDQNSCTPANASMDDFPIAPGGTMPVIDGCNKQDYAVLFVIGVVEEEPVKKGARR